MDRLLDERVPEPPEPDPERVASRAEALRRERPDLDDPEAAAEELLRESAARTEADPAPRTLDEERVDRRASEDAVPPER